MSHIIVAPSLLAADPLKFLEEIKSVEKAGADWHHIDVMDGHFVPNLTFGIPLVKALKAVTSIPLDVHIMVSNPDDVALDYVKAGADLLVFHVEAAKHTHRLLHAIRDHGAKAGIALNPGTPIEAVLPVLGDVDVVMLMSVNPGFGGQKFIPQTISRVKRLAAELTEHGLEHDVIIEVDGGVNAENGRRLVQAGARALVAGTYVYGATNRADPIAQLHSLQ